MQFITNKTEAREDGSSDSVSEPAPKQPGISIEIPEACTNGDCDHGSKEEKKTYNPI